MEGLLKHLVNIRLASVMREAYCDMLAACRMREGLVVASVGLYFFIAVERRYCAGPIDGGGDTLLVARQSTWQWREGGRKALITTPSRPPTAPATHIGGIN
ncbi:hypothetical protein E2C01_003437 [Portunus trituberculatus]|uniref:Uncharacterized protein n=1 Tax=Portunus trituberculatus TaxID=210409 RepID=A0A5B7CR33_PORTR|nr:hypothetical protein [Portunus trituberculatus]